MPFALFFFNWPDHQTNTSSYQTTMSSSLEAISPRRLYRVIADQLAERIRTGEFAIGDRLPSERELSERLQVSRSSVREALLALEIAGWVEVRVGSGVFVMSTHQVEAATAPGNPALRAALHAATDMSPFELLDVRLLLEPECAALAAQNATPEQVAEILAIQRSMSAAGTPNDYDRLFHDAIGAACGNAALASALSHVWDLSEDSPVFQRLDQHFVTARVWRLALQEHERVCAAIADGDPIRARHAMTQHLIGIVARLREDVPEVLESAATPPQAGAAASRRGTR